MKTIDTKTDTQRHGEMSRLVSEVLSKKKVRYEIDTIGVLELEKTPEWYTATFYWGDKWRMHVTNSAEALYDYLCGFIDAIYI